MTSVLFRLSVFLVFVTLSTTISGQDDQFSWPGGARAAVCLTYDDGMDTQLSNAIPDLDKHNLQGTFYLQGDLIPYERVDIWRELSRKGHELGNHTAFHPCSEKFPWVWTEFQTETYTVRRMIKELQVMNYFLYAIDGRENRTYAFACSETRVGGISFIDSLRHSGLFIGARGGGPGIVDDLQNLDIFNVPSWGVNLSVNAEDMIGFVKEAVRAEGLAVFMFHGIGGEYLYITHEDHTLLIEYLDNNRDEIWVAPFGEVVKHIINERQRLGWKHLNGHNF
ncbi:MAG: polysaccharide deacetylase family protein [Bacteroidales bacterium]|nr:polysaccharide deacetylase family protein [Bacteroidales bacterium]